MSNHGEKQHCSESRLRSWTIFCSSFRKFIHYECNATIIRWQWSIKMRKALAVKNKFKFVDGSIPIPEYVLNCVVWERCNNLVHAWIINLISHSIALWVVFIENAADMWNDLKDRFMRGDRIRVTVLIHKLVSSS